MTRGMAVVLALLILLWAPFIIWGCRPAEEEFITPPGDEAEEQEGEEAGEEEPDGEEAPPEQDGESENGASGQQSKTVRLTLYFPDRAAVESGIEGETGYVKAVVRELPHTTGVLRLAMEELIRGPQPDEGNLGRIIPAATKVRGVKIENGVATINFSAELINSPDSPGGTLGSTLFVQSIVYTATEFSTVQAVLVQVEGEPYCDGHYIWDQPVSRPDCGG